VATLNGGCLCGRVRYQVSGRLSRVSHCHCSMCRKLHGATFGTYATVEPGGFRWLQGEERVMAYRSSASVGRTFCSDCGSTLQFIVYGDPAKTDITLGTLDGDPQVRPGYHIYVGSKAPWFEITDDLPQYEERKPE
jgi:hypothetical protein